MKFLQKIMNQMQCQCLAFCSVIFILFIGFPASAEPQPSDTIPTYVYWQGEASEARKPFESALMKLIFSLSEEKFGPAKLEISQWKISSARSIQLMKEGQRLHIQNAPYLLQEIDKSAVIVLPTPILHNLLGYRNLIIRKQDAKSFLSIDSRADFSKKIAGQGRGWADNYVYRHNNIRVFEASSFAGMFPMLHRKRFDYVPLGVSEASDTLQLEALQKYDFTIAEGIVVFYPWPIHILVSIKHPDLASRIQYGLQQAQKKGLYDKLFHQHFDTLLDGLQKMKVNVIQLETPNLPEQIPTTPIFIPNANYLK